MVDGVAEVFPLDCFSYGEKREAATIVRSLEEAFVFVTPLRRGDVSFVIH
jgi:hypothetical protein